MTNRLLGLLRRFARRENGSLSIEFVIVVPIFLYLMMAGVEIGVIAFHHANLERALDETVRDVRLNHIEKYDPTPGAEWDHDLLKRIICDNADFIKDCDANLALEMKSVDLRNGIELHETPFCVDTPEDIRNTESGTGQEYNQGAANELMVLRACVEIFPIFHGSNIGQMAQRDSDGQYELHATTVFVHEPN